MNMRLVTVSLVLGAALADSAGQHALAYYALVAAVPAAAVAALLALGDVLDGTAASPLDRFQTLLCGLALPFLLIATAVRAPVLNDGAVPAIGVTAVGVCLALLALQSLLAALDAVPSKRVRTALRGPSA